MSTRSHPDTHTAPTRTTPTTDPDRAARCDRGLREIVEDAHAAIEFLMLGVYNNVPAGELAQRLVDAQTLLQRAIGVLVVRERSEGRTLEGIGKAVKRTVDRLRKKYPPREIDAYLSARKRAQRHRQARTNLVSSDQPAWRRPHQRLAAALSLTVDRSGRSQRYLAGRLKVSPSYISRMLSGERPASWKHVNKICKECQADPELLRPLWEVADGVLVKPEDPAGYLRNYLHALHYAAGSPSEDTVLAAMSPLTVHQLRQALDGPGVPDWDVVAQVVTALKGLSQTAHPLWRRACGTPKSGPISAESFG